jgi:hypothetical protein
MSNWSNGNALSARRCAAGLATVAVAMATFAVAAVPAHAAPDARPVNCTLSASGSARGGDSGWGSCVQVTTTLDRAPRVGESAQLRVTVLAQRDWKAVPVEVDLPEGLRWQQTPAGLRTAPALADTDTGRSPVSRASTRIDLASGSAQTFTGTVVATGAGYAEIRARAVASAREQGADAVHLTIGETSSAFGYLGASATRTTAVPAGAVVERAETSLPFRPLAKSRLAEPHSDDERGVQPMALACASGRWTYLDGGASRPSRNFQVQAWDEDTFGDDLLSTTLTDGDGRYRVCFDNNDGPFSGGQDLYIRFVADNGQWNVERDEDEPLEFFSNTVNNVGNGTTTDFGTLQPSDNAMHRGLHAYDAANDASAWTPGDCWDARDTSCKMIHIRWAPDSQTGTFYCPTDDFANCDSDDTVRLLPDDPNDPLVVVHELGHAVMDDAYEDNFPDFPNCQNHRRDTATSAGCAWVEGFADWYAISIYGRTAIIGWELEDRHWGDGWATGDTVEGRVSGSLNDISDARNAAPTNNETWDRYTEGAPGRIFDTLLAHRSANFRQFWDQRVADGFDAAPERALGCLFQNTIDYGFRDPLTDGTAYTRPEAFTAHNYRIDTTRLFWSVVAVRPDGTSDHDVALYDDNAQTQHLITSAAAGTTIDFVAIDSNPSRRPLGDYYPRISRASGTGGYAIQYAQATLLSGSDAITMTAADVVAVRDVFLTAGTDVTISVTPSNPGQDPELFVLASLDAPDTWFQRRSSAAASATGNGPGLVEQVTYTPPRTGFFAVVVINRVGAGTYTVQVT